LLDLRRELPDFPDDFRGTFAPFLRASLSPMAIACLRLLTVRPDPLFSVPFFRRRIVDSTLFDADSPYFAMFTSARRIDRTSPGWTRRARIGARGRETTPAPDLR